MADDKAEVRLGAQTGEMTAGVKDAAASIDASLRKMADALKGFSDRSKQDSEEVKRHNKELELSFSQLKDKIGGAVDGIKGHIERIKSVAGAVTGAVAGGLLWKEAVDSAKEFGHEISVLQRVMGFGGQEAQQYAIALKIAGSSADDFSTMVMHTGRQLKVNADEFERLGVSVKNARGEFLPMDQVLQHSLDTLLEFKPGIDQDMVSLTLFGRSARDAVEMLEKLEQAKARAAQMQKEFGFSDAELKRIKDYRIEANALGETLSLIGAKIGIEVMPGLTNLAKYFSETGPSAAKVIITAVKGIITSFDLLGTASHVAYVYVANSFTSLADHVRNAAAMIANALLAITNPGALLKSPFMLAEGTVQRNAAVAKEVEKLWADSRARVANLWTDSTIPGSAGTNGRAPGTRTYTPPPKGGGSDVDDTLAQWKQTLREAQMAEGYFHDMSKAEEADFWRAKLGLINTGTKEGARLYREVYALMFEADKAYARDRVEVFAATQRRMIDEAQNDKQRQMLLADQLVTFMEQTYTRDSKQYEAALDVKTRLTQQWVHKEQEIMLARTKLANDQAAFEVRLDQLAADQGVALRQLSTSQKLALEARFADRLYEQQRAEAEAYRATLDSRTKEYVEATARIQKIEQDHQEKLTQIANQAEQERMKYALDAAQATQDAFTGFLSSLSDKTKSLTDKIKAAFASLEQSLMRIAAQKVSDSFLGAGTQGGGVLADFFGKLFGGGVAGGAGGATLTVAGTTLTTAGTLLTTAAVALQAAAATMSASAFLGPTASFAGGIGALYGLPAFASGTPYVPRDMVAIVHQGERIVPAGQNRPGAGGGSLHVTNHFAISGPVDGRTQDQIATAAARSISRAAARNRSA